MKLNRIIPKKIYNKLYIHFKNIVLSDLKNTKCVYELNVTDKGKLNKKVAIVTGGSGALGSAISFRLAMEGATVIICGRNTEKLEFVCRAIKENNGIAISKKLDVTDKEQIEQVFKDIYDNYGHIDILINNAGGGARGEKKLLYQQKDNVIDEIIDLNLKGTIFCSKKVIEYMLKKNYGKIINISSVVGINGMTKYSEYAAAKAGIIGLTKSLAMELAPYGINVNCISPGMINQIIFDKPLEAKETNKSFIGKMGKTDEIANAVAFLVSDEANYIVGQNLVIDGGRTLGLKGS